MGIGAACFLENGSFLTKYGHESSDFFLKIGKKGYHIDFFGPSKQVEKMLDIIGAFWDKIDFFFFLGGGGARYYTRVLIKQYTFGGNIQLSALKVEN